MDQVVDEEPRHRAVVFDDENLVLRHASRTIGRRMVTTVPDLCCRAPRRYRRRVLARCWPRSSARVRCPRLRRSTHGRTCRRSATGPRAESPRHRRRSADTPSGRTATADPQRSRGRRVLDRIVEHVVERVQEASAIRPDHRQRTRYINGHGEAQRIEPRLQTSQDVVNQIRKIARHELVDAEPMHPGKPQQVLNQLGQSRALRRQDVRVVLDGLRPGNPAAAERLSGQLDIGQRRLERVRDIGNELCFDRLRPPPCGERRAH